MTTDVVALCLHQPDVAARVGALLAAGPDLGVSLRERGAAVLLLDEADELVCSIEAPLLVQVPGEARRLLGPALPVDAPQWWIEIRSPSARPADVARRVAEHFVDQLGGLVWPPAAAPGSDS